MREFVIFLGAGASAPFGIPTMTKMAENFERQLIEESSPNLDLYKYIQSRLKGYRIYDIEALITVLQDMDDFKRVESRVLSNASAHYFWGRGGDIETLVEVQKQFAQENHEMARELLVGVKNFIADACTMRKQPFEIYDEFFHQIIMKVGYDFKKIIKSGKPPQRVNLGMFTTNYDRVLESYCDSRELVFRCGETDNQKVDISTQNRELYSEDNPVFRILKLHGSVNWYRDEHNRMRCGSEAVRVGRITSLGHRVEKEVLIYPAFEKYTFREPFYTMFHNLKSCLIDFACVNCYIVGYSFRDEDILGLFHDSMELNRALKVWLIDPDADTIKKRFGQLSARVQTVPMEFSVEAAGKLA
jgi:hypothetical protein